MVDMDTIFASIIGASSALLGAALTANIQLRTQRNSHLFQHESDDLKRQNEKLEREISLALERLTTAHLLLSAIGREFSQAKILINWKAEMTDGEYDQKYLAICQDMDELRAIAGLYETALSDDVETLHRCMNRFWGEFQNVLRLSALGQNVNHETSCYNATHVAATEIQERTRTLKERLTKQAEKYRNLA